MIVFCWTKLFYNSLLSVFSSIVLLFYCWACHILILHYKRSSLSLLKLIKSFFVCCMDLTTAKRMVSKELSFARLASGFFYQFCITKPFVVELSNFLSGQGNKVYWCLTVWNFVYLSNFLLHQCILKFISALEALEYNSYAKASWKASLLLYTIFLELLNWMNIIYCNIW